MAQRLSRRAGPEHPVLFSSDADIPPAPTLPDPGAATELSRYRALLDEAEVVDVATAAEAPSGRQLVVAGRREPAAAHEDAVAILDDGTARLPLVLAASAGAALRDCLRARLLVVSATTHGSAGCTVLRVTEAHDLRKLGAERDALTRSTRALRSA